MMKISSVGAMIAVALLTACGSDKATGPDQSNPNGSFTATIAGGVQSSYRGLAAFGVNQAEAAFGLVLSDSTHGAIIFAQRTGAAPGTGTHQLADASNGDPGDNDLIAAVIHGPGSNLQGAFVAKSGTLTITDRSSTTLKGSFQFTATGGLTGSEAQVDITVNGTFTAHGGTVNIPNYTIRQRVVARR